MFTTFLFNLQLDMCLTDVNDVGAYSKTFVLPDAEQGSGTPPPSPNPSCSSSVSTCSSTSSGLQRRRVHPSGSKKLKRSTATTSGSASGSVVRPALPDAPVSLQDEVDQLMDHSIEIDSNKKIRNEHVNPWTLTFLQEDLELKVNLLSTWQLAMNFIYSFIYLFIQFFFLSKGCTQS